MGTCVGESGQDVRLQSVDALLDLVAVEECSFCVCRI